ncbi:MAG: polyribonucleotide nucleotidyltransferase, partial [Bryobacteraceae bacterium]|nr:polyribonucleotide nucleotidyltransferase [Bryobacteraceae bacterium]
MSFGTVHSVTIDLQGEIVTLETGKLAKQANGAVVVKHRDNVILCTACGTQKPKAGQDWFPLTVDYREYTYAAGRYPGGFIKREGRPSEKEIISCRLIDRPIRPLFPEGYFNEVQLANLVMSADPEFDPGPLAIAGSAAALAISDIPFGHVLAGLRVALVKGELVAIPTYAQTKEAEFHIVVAGTKDGIVMVEAGGKGADEEGVLRCIEFGHECCKKLVAGIEELKKKAGKAKFAFTPTTINQDIFAKIEAAVREELTDALNTEKYGKLESYARVDAAKAKAKALFTEEAEIEEAADLFDRLKEKIFRDDMLVKRRRPDGREFTQVRPIDIEVGVLPRTHGSALFQRGETQALVTCTLGTKDDEQRIELLDKEVTSKRFMLHYNFPPFSVGECGRMGAPGRREIGHGLLAERAVSAVVPGESEFPYTIRLVSDILESNGSSSMASVCGGILALMDAGVKIPEPVAGIAMGLVIEGDKYAILTDIAGAEDHYGDMDFKVAGTHSKVTALQMDLKVTNVSLAIMKEALDQAKKARLEILDKMNAVIDKPRTELSKYAPRIFSMTIPTDKIREVIGPGGKMIRSIVDATGTKIDINDDGT